jgi:uncharacterized protein
MTPFPLPLVAAPPRAAADPEGNRPWFGSDPTAWHRFDAGGRSYLFVTDASQVYEIDGRAFDGLVARLGSAGLGGAALTAFGVPTPGAIRAEAPLPVPLRSLSLAVAQKCNLGCTYCYAQEGDFGGEAKEMPLAVAVAAVDRLLAECPPGQRVHLSFLGGEPLLARAVLRAATDYAVRLGRERGVRVGLAVTTNGTLVTPDDGEFFERNGFAVTVSLDGIGAAHDAQRAYKGGAGSFDRIVANVRPLLAGQRQMQVSARVTVTPRNLDLAHTLDGLIDLGFHSVGFSPMLASPTGRDQLGRHDLTGMLEQMIACGHVFERRVVTGERYPFANAVNAMKEIHRGTHRPYPCGAGAGYFGVSADGELAACHRFVGDAQRVLGDVSSGVDRARQTRWLQERHVDSQEPCRSCWARYLCGGGCHHEVIHRGRPACDYIRGWLHYCLEAYARLLAARPDFFGIPAVAG